ncbi:hypothetical protein HMPREF0290_1573 [Corynebacterium efficiens YS-314]|nr:hypothetical protein HMPREF0290_1573 [Corynebacterium efficiens YS-314]
MRKLASLAVAVALSLSISPAAQATEMVTPKAMDRIAVKCNVHKIWSFPSLDNYDGWVVVGHAYLPAEAEKRANTFVPLGHYKRHCLPVPIDRFPFEGLHRS